MVQAWEKCLNQTRPARASAPFGTAETRAAGMDRFSRPEVSALRVLPVLALDPKERTVAASPQRWVTRLEGRAAD